MDIRPYDGGLARPIGIQESRSMTMSRMTNIKTMGKSNRRGTPKMAARLAQAARTIDQVMAWANDELEGFAR
jgi:predicted patatin/cPLA2 family phospholipase